MRILFIAIVITVALGVITHLWAMAAFKRYAEQLIVRLRNAAAGAPVLPRAEVTAPGIVKRFAERAGVASNDVPQSVMLRQSAEMRMSPDKPWQPLSAQQAISIYQPGFVWYAEQLRADFVTLRVVDAYVDGHGLLKARLLGSIPVANFEGAQADQSELMRYLAELPWAPDAMMRNPLLHWRQLDENTVEVSADSNGGIATVRLYFDDAGDIHEIQADERGSTENGKVIPRPWIGRFSAYAELGGRRVPTRAEVGYVYDDGYAAYWRGEIIEYELQRN